MGHAMPHSHSAFVCGQYANDAAHGMYSAGSSRVICISPCRFLDKRISARWGLYVMQPYCEDQRAEMQHYREG